MAPLLLAPAARAASASEVVHAGSLSLAAGAPADVTFPETPLGSLGLLASRSQSFDVNDASGSGSGWSISATSTPFTAGTHALPVDATAILAPPADVCDVGSSCSLAVNTVAYPYLLPAATTQPVATKMFNAAAGTGQGAQTITPEWSLAVPAETFVGRTGVPYVADWTLTLISGP